jgi:hypothetical protein
MSHLERLRRIEPRATSVLKEIDVAVKKRLHSDHKPVRKLDRFVASIRMKAKELKRMYKDPDELDELRRNVQNVVDGFTVSRSPALYIATLKIYCACSGVFSAS